MHSCCRSTTLPNLNLYLVTSAAEIYPMKYQLHTGLPTSCRHGKINPSTIVAQKFYYVDINDNTPMLI